MFSWMRRAVERAGRLVAALALPEAQLLDRIKEAPPVPPGRPREMPRLLLRLPGQPLPVDLLLPEPPELPQQKAVRRSKPAPKPFRSP